MTGTMDGPPSDRITSDTRPVSVDPGTWTMPAIGVRPRRSSATETTSTNSPEDEIPTTASPGPESRAVAEEVGGSERDHDRVIGTRVAAIEVGRGEAGVVTGAVADDVDAPDAEAAPAFRDLAGGLPGRGNRGADGGGPFADLARDDPLDHGTSPRATRGRRVIRGGDDHPYLQRSDRLQGPHRHRIVGHQHVHLLEPEHEAGRHLLELGGIGEDDDRAGHPPQGAVREDLRVRSRS